MFHSFYSFQNNHALIFFDKLVKMLKQKNKRFFTYILNFLPFKLFSDPYSFIKMLPFII